MCYGFNFFAYIFRIKIFLKRGLIIALALPELLVILFTGSVDVFYVNINFLNKGVDAFS